MKCFFYFLNERRIMDEQNQVDQFDKELGCVIQRFALEYDLSYPIMIGVLEMHKMDLWWGRFNRDDEEGE